LDLQAALSRAHCLGRLAKLAGRHRLTADVNLFDSVSIGVSTRHDPRPFAVSLSGIARRGGSHCFSSIRGISERTKQAPSSVDLSVRSPRMARASRRLSASPSPTPGADDAASSDDLLNASNSRRARSGRMPGGERAAQSQAEARKLLGAASAPSADRSATLRRMLLPSEMESSGRNDS